MFKLSIELVLYIERAPLASLRFANRTDRYKNLLLHAVAIFCALNTTERSLSIHGNCTGCIISHGYATPKLGTAKSTHTALMYQKSQ